MVAAHVAYRLICVAFCSHKFPLPFLDARLSRSTRQTRRRPVRKKTRSTCSSCNLWPAWKSRFHKEKTSSVILLDKGQHMTDRLGTVLAAAGCCCTMWSSLSFSPPCSFITDVTRCEAELERWEFALSGRFWIISLIFLINIVYFLKNNISHFGCSCRPFQKRCDVYTIHYDIKRLMFAGEWVFD